MRSPLPYEYSFPRRSNVDSVSVEQVPKRSHSPAENTLFASGIWEYQYNQYNQWFGPFQHRIDFDPMRKTLRGYGKDNVGEYVLKGSFSLSHAQLEMALQYQVNRFSCHLSSTSVLRFHTFLPPFSQARVIRI